MTYIILKVLCHIYLGPRSYTAAPSLLERVVPTSWSTSKNGASDDVYDMMGYALPPGSIVATQAWSMHRDPSIFPSPDTFLPERWLKSSSTPDQLSTMAAYMMPFGTGSRMCRGHNLAQVMLRVTVASFVRNFDFSAPPETHERSMDVKDSFVRCYALRRWSYLIISRLCFRLRWSVNSFPPPSTTNAIPLIPISTIFFHPAVFIVYFFSFCHLPF